MLPSIVHWLAIGYWYAYEYYFVKGIDKELCVFAFRPRSNAFFSFLKICVRHGQPVGSQAGRQARQSSCRYDTGRIKIHLHAHKKNYNICNSFNDKILYAFHVKFYRNIELHTFENKLKLVATGPGLQKANKWIAVGTNKTKKPLNDAIRHDMITTTIYTRMKWEREKPVLPFLSFVCSLFSSLCCKNYNRANSFVICFPKWYV